MHREDSARNNSVAQEFLSATLRDNAKNFTDTDARITYYMVAH